MITKSNPFLRNDYYPDQNDIDELNTRINEVQSDVDLLAISVNEKAEAVNGRLNTLQNDYNESFETDALKANTADINVLNVNVQAVIKDLNAIDTYTENLIVNKPVQDISLRTPHLENTTSLNGNFYAPNIIGGEIDSVSFTNIQNFKTIDFEADGIKANKLIVDFSAEPISSSAVVGYDENGQLIPIRASYDVSFPEDADYLKTDTQGVARKGTSESEVVQSTNLIQAGAVQNMYDTVNANIQNMYDTVNASFDTVNASFDNVQNTFNDFANNLNNVNLATENQFNDVNNTFNDVNNSLNDISQNLNDALQNLVGSSQDLSDINDYIFNGFYLPGYGTFNSMSPVNYQNATSVKIYGDVSGGTSLSGGGGQILFKGSTNEVVFGFSGSTACRGITNCYEMFRNCKSLNQNIRIPLDVKNCTFMFAGCSSLNQNILIPNSAIGCGFMFASCSSFDQNILIPNSVKDCTGMFAGSHITQNILIPNSVTICNTMFRNCSSFNQNILIPNSVTSCFGMFDNSHNFNQNIAIPNSVTICEDMFYNCTNLNQNILIPNSVTHCTNMFRNCTNLNRDIYIYFQNVTLFEGQIPEIKGMFTNTKVNLHNVHIPSSVPKVRSNTLYNCLINGNIGVVFAAANIINDLPVDPVVWPPVN